MSRYFDQTRNFTIDYDQMPRPYHSVIAEIVSAAAHKHPSILDMGSGVGNTLAEIERLGTPFLATAADIDPECLRRTQARFPEARTLLLDAPHDIYSVSDHYDVVVLSHVLQYDHDPVRLLRHLLSLLRPDGYLVVAIPNLVTPARFAAYCRNISGAQGVYYWDQQSFSKFVTDVVGATVVEVHSDYVPLPGENRATALTKIGRKLVKRLPLLSFSTICVVRK